jgi:hypothetical protein
MAVKAKGPPVPTGGEGIEGEIRRVILSGRYIFSCKKIHLTIYFIQEK